MYEHKHRDDVHNAVFGEIDKTIKSDAMRGNLMFSEDSDTCVIDSSLDGCSSHLNFFATVRFLASCGVA